MMETGFIAAGHSMSIQHPPRHVRQSSVAVKFQTVNGVLRAYLLFIYTLGLYHRSKALLLLLCHIGS